MKDEVMLTPTRSTIKKSLPGNNRLTPAFLTLTKVSRSWRVIARRHYDSNGNHNGYLLPYSVREGTPFSTFVWTEQLPYYGLSVTTT